MRVVHVRLSEESGVEALFVDDEQVAAGDAGNSISTRIDGIMHGLQIMGWDGRVQLYVIEGEGPYDDCPDGECIPEYFDELDLTKARRKATRWGAY